MSLLAFIAIAGLTVLLLVGFYSIIQTVNEAPDGHEDSAGFHFEGSPSIAAATVRRESERLPTWSAAEDLVLPQKPGPA